MSKNPGRFALPHRFPFLHAPPIRRRAMILGGLFGAFVMVSAIFAANWVTTDYGFIHVGFGFYSTAGTIFAGFSLAARDLVQDTLGRVVVVGVILLGTLVSWWVSEPAIAVASVSAYLFAELLDFAIYTPLRAKSKVGDRRWAAAVFVSNLVGAVADTVIFLGIAFGAAAIQPAIAGQLVGKGWATLAYLTLGFLGSFAVRAYMGRRRARRAALSPHRGQFTEDPPVQDPSTPSLHG